MSVTVDLKQNASLSVECQWTTGGIAKDLTDFTLAAKIKDKNDNLVHTFIYLTDLMWVNRSLGMFKMEIIDISEFPLSLLKTDIVFTHTSTLKSATKVFNYDNSKGIT